jgi:hypothetical protein
MTEHDVVDREEIGVQSVAVPDGLEHIRAALPNATVLQPIDWRSPRRMNEHHVAHEPG